jgi:cation diffusion facilitator family transporter
MANSISICADAVNNLADSCSSVITLIGFRLSEKPADAEHPYGHARIEFITGLIVSLIVTFIGGQLLIDSVMKIISPIPSDYTALTVIILTIAILIKVGQYFFYRYSAKIINSVSLKASATDSLTDCVATSAVLIGIIITKLTEINMDGWLGAAVSIFIVYSGIRLIIQTSNPLLGNAPDKKLTDSISEKILNYDGVVGIHDLIIHSYGAGICYATIHVEVSADTDILEMHDLINDIEVDVSNSLNINLVIHLDPIVLNDERVNNLRRDAAEIINSISPHISMHDFRVIRNTLVFDICVPPKYNVKDKELSRRISKEIKERNPVITKVIIIVDRNYSYTVSRG